MEVAFSILEIIYISRLFGITATWPFIFMLEVLQATHC